ncbi:unannotated protein [freshwater metagenome]|uniref:Unannotated protein n=1 Tax=freshwater metagenome TaxID=449393 RepID=A0A6J6TBH9_9ZZZZ
MTVSGQVLCPPLGSSYCPLTYDNALAESQIGLYKAELIRPEGPWRGVEHVELETLNWVDFFNTERPHEALDDLTPIAAEELHYAARNELTPTG